ncbi:MAG TPA: hypothetical protein VFG81_04685 [Anaerolineales bacterium]|nr:hypothetical protein [Anaerolineales bacterium]
MPEIRCPNCGRNNPDLLDVCQFCQTPLKPESILHSGETPTKKNTGELQSILPDWLKDIQQQSNAAAEEDAAQAARLRSSQKEEPADLLAGLASQTSGAEEEDVPDWLSGLSPGATTQSPASSSNASDSDFFAKFNQKETEPDPVNETPPQEDVPSWMGGMREEATIPIEKDELSEWFTQASEQPEEVVKPGEQQNDINWESAFVDSPPPETSAPKEEEDLSWLHNLESVAKQTGDLQTPKRETDWTANFETSSTPSSGDDLSWLDRLGGIEEPSQPAPAQTTAPSDDLSWLDQFGGESSRPSQPSEPPAASQQDLNWLNNLGDAPEPHEDAASNQPVSSPPFASEQDLDWLNKLGEGSEPEQPAEPFREPVEAQAPAEDLRWLNDVGKPAEPSVSAAQPPVSQEDLNWLNELGGESEPLPTPPFEQAESETTTPRQIASLSQEATDETEPDWLKSATENSSMPAPGDLSMGWFSSAGKAEGKKILSSAPQTSPFERDISSVPEEPASLSNQDVDSLFSVDMPDWLSQTETETAVPSPQPVSSESVEGDELAPVDLPSWVQAMRPVEAVITETTPSVSDQSAETEGPLAGLHGVIPMAPVGPSRRPSPVSLTLQASDEQQASAMLLEQILGSETSPRTLVVAPVVTSQQWLRWALSGLLLLILSAVILMRSQLMPVSASLPGEGVGLTNAIMGIPANSRILVVIDYEPALAGEMEAVAGPLLDQVVLLSQPTLSFISTSPSGAALVERLLVNTGVDQAGVSYLNLGYLPGGPAGVLGFIEGPGQIVPLAGVGSFSEYSALLVLTDHAESGRIWVEQLQNRKAVDPALSNQPLLVAASAQAGPLLQPYVSSRQINGLISGLADAARYEFVNNSRPGIARSYWDTFGIGLILSVALIVIGSLWSIVTGMRARRVNAEQG